MAPDQPLFFSENNLFGTVIGNWQLSREVSRKRALEKTDRTPCAITRIIHDDTFGGTECFYRYGPATHRGERVELLDEKPPGPFHVPAVGHEAALRPVKNDVVSVAKTAVRETSGRQEKPIKEIR